MKYARWIKFEQMKKKLLLRWLRCVFSLRLPWRAHNGLRDSAINRFAFFIDAQRVSQTSQPANFIANPTFQNFFRRHSRLSRLFASAPPQKRSGLWPNWVSLAKCLHESIGVDSFWSVCRRRSVSLFVTLLATRSGQASSTSIKE